MSQEPYYIAEFTPEFLTLLKGRLQVRADHCRYVSYVDFDVTPLPGGLDTETRLRIDHAAGYFFELTCSARHDAYQGAQRFRLRLNPGFTTQIEVVPEEHSENALQFVERWVDRIERRFREHFSPPTELAPLDSPKHFLELTLEELDVRIEQHIEEHGDTFTEEDIELLEAQIDELATTTQVQIDKLREEIEALKASDAEKAEEINALSARVAVFERMKADAEMIVYIAEATEGKKKHVVRRYWDMFRRADASGVFNLFVRVLQALLENQNILPPPG